LFIIFAVQHDGAPQFLAHLVFLLFPTNPEREHGKPDRPTFVGGTFFPVDAKQASQPISRHRLVGQGHPGERRQGECVRVVLICVSFGTVAPFEPFFPPLLIRRIAADLEGGKGAQGSTVKVHGPVVVSFQEGSLIDPALQRFEGCFGPSPGPAHDQHGVVKHEGRFTLGRQSGQKRPGAVHECRKVLLFA